MSDRKVIEQPVAVEFKRFNEDFDASLRSQERLLQHAIDIIFESTGKHIRPLMVLLSAKACGKITENTINSAVLLELLHTATLIHDDVVDETKLRRGVSSLNAIFDNRIAVLVGDYVLSSALVRSTLTQNLRIITIISSLGRELAEGEICQLETAEETVVDEVRYMEVIKKKTASMLSATCEIGAITAEASPEIVSSCAQFGELLGFCFQIKDDIFDYYHDASIGKPTGNDIKEGKVTLPLLFALQNGDKVTAAKCKAIIDEKAFSDENIEFLIRFAIENGGIEYAEKRMKEYHDQAIELINRLPKSEAQQSLVMLADYIIQRNN